jgi:hypothetical protein
VELPVAVNDFVPAARHSRPAAPVVNIRLESRAPVITGRKAVVFVMLGVVVSAVLAEIAYPVFLPDAMRDRIDAMRVSRSWQQLRPGDDYSAVVSKLGAPSAQRTYVETGGRVFRSLDYPRRHFTAVLEGRTEADARYVGSLDALGRILGNSPVSDVSLLRSIPRF